VIVSTESLQDLQVRLVMVDGSFDPIHEGHVAYFAAAAALGLPVLCNIAPDSWTSSKHAVLLSQVQRSVVIDAFRDISYVHASLLSTKDVLSALKPAIYAKGNDWKERGGIPSAEQQICDDLGIEVVYLDTVLNSSSALLNSWKSVKGNQ
jgi:bifunctional ADP-heptose synthase (sugar kinase/adenylyltransferase)